MRFYAAVLLLACAGSASAADTYTFDAAEFARKPFEIGGYVEYRHDRFRLNRGGVYYGLAYYNNERRSTVGRDAAALKLEGRYTIGAASLRARTHVEYVDDNYGAERVSRFEELAASWKPDPGFTLDAGKIAQKWGKGYAWNPVGFVERMKDPSDPELSREGYWMGTADWVKTFSGPLKTIAFTPVVLPTGKDVNSDFGRTGHTNYAAKLYLLWHDTDIDFMYQGGGSRAHRFGFDFSRNVTSNLEVHGEWARIRDFDKRAVSRTGTPRVTRGDADSYLLGVRYLTKNDTTCIVEYYRNGTGYTENEMRDFFGFAGDALGRYDATGIEGPVARANAAVLSGYGRGQAMQRYFYARVSQKDPFAILYFTPAITTIANVSDGSFQVTPELTYTGFTNVELRLRFFYLKGSDLSDFGEKQNARRIEFRARFFF